MNAVSGALVLDFGVGLGALLVGIGVFIALARLGGLFSRVEKTLDEVDRQIATLAVPVTDTLGHVEGIAGTADATIARLAAVVGSLEAVAGGVAKTTTLAQHALAPSLVNLAATVSGISAGLRKLVGANTNSTSYTKPE